MAKTVRFEPQALRARLEALFVAKGADDEAAAQVADALVEADLRGVVTHGATRAATYVERIERGQLDPRARPSVIADGGGVVILDAARGFGAVAGVHATDLAMARAREHGSAFVAVRNTNHFGIAGYYTDRMARAGFLGFAFCNAGASMPAPGGRSAVVGTNPISIAVPCAEHPPVLDMAVTHVARGKIRRAAAEGRPIPDGWATDAQGRPTNDADAALAGMLVPMGEHKGFALAVMIDLMTGVLADGACSTGVRGATDFEGDAGVCFAVMAIDVSRVTEVDAFARRVQAYREGVAATARPGHTTWLPGDPEHEAAERHRTEGIDLPADVATALERIEKG